MAWRRGRASPAAFAPREAVIPAASSRPADPLPKSRREIVSRGSLDTWPGLVSIATVCGSREPHGLTAISSIYEARAPVGPVLVVVLVLVAVLVFVPAERVRRRARGRLRLRRRD